MPRPLRIGIAAFNLLPGKMGGMEDYFHDLLANLQAYDSLNHYIVFIPKEHIGSINVTASNFKLVGTQETMIDKTRRKLGLGSILAKTVNRHNPDLIHFPLQNIMPTGIKGKKIVTIMDIQEKYLPQFFTPEERRGRECLLRSTLKQADKIIAISKFTKQTLCEKYNVTPRKIEVVHLSFNPELFNSSHPAEVLDLPDKYFYFPGATWPHKNHARLIDAFAKLKKDPKFADYKLILSGISKQKTDDIADQIKSLGLNNAVINLGYIPKEAQFQVYNNAVAMVFPSLFEGFGIPLLEAMAMGCPVLCSGTTSLPEVAGNAALTFDPTDISAITDSMAKIASSRKLRESLVEAGRKQQKKFSGEKMAKQTLAVYMEVARQ